MQAQSTAQASSKRKRKPQQPPTEYANDIQLAQRYAVSRATIWRWHKDGIIPPAIKLGPNVTRWKLADVIAALEQSA